MVNFRIIYKIIGSLLFLEAFFMGWCLVIGLVHHEDDVLAFLVSMLLTFGCGFLSLYLGRDAENALSRRDAYVVVTAAWVIFSFFGMFPFLIHGSILNFTDAYFETMSGFTTTGASIIDDVERLPHAILFWRSLMLVDSEVAEFVAAEGSRVTRNAVKDLGLPFGVTIGGLVRNGVGMLVNGNSQILPGDSVMVFCHEQKLNNIEKFFKKGLLW